MPVVSTQSYCYTVPKKKAKLPLSKTHPKLAKEADGWDPSTLTAGSNKKVEWRCTLGHIFEADVSNRVQGRGCPFCANRKVLKGFNDLATTNPELTKEANGWDPSEFTFGSKTKVSWICLLGHVWITSISNRPRTGCPICANRVVVTGVNDLATTNPELAKEAYGWDPSSFSKGMNVKKEWKCALGHLFKTTINNRSNDRGCPYCSGNKVLVGFNDLATTHPDLAQELIDGDAKKISKGSTRKYTWKCNLSHTWKAGVDSRTNMESGCPSCAVFGFNPSKDGFLYFLTHPRWDMYQIGISNFPDDRVHDHKKRGWDLLELRGPMDGHLTQQWETAILRMLKAKGADLSNKEIAGKFDGYSEAWSKSTFPVKSIKELMRLTEEFEEDKK